MAKAPETQDRFRIYCEANSPEEMGVVVAQLTRMGLKNVGFEMITDVLAFKRRKQHDQTAADAFRDYVESNPTFHISDAIKHFKAEGRTSSSVYSAAGALCEKKLLKKLGGGNYSVANIKQIEGPKEPRSKVQKIKKNPERSGRAEILKFIGNRKSFTVKQLRALFVSQGRNGESVSPAVTDLVWDKIIKHGAERGEYLVMKNNKKSPAKKAAVKKLNGANPASTEHVNG